MHVLITRPIEDAEPLKARIEALGCRVTVAPLIEIVSNDLPVDVVAGATGVIATSRNALAALTASPALPLAIKRTLYVVGPGTASAARKMGFQDVVEGAGRAEDLVPILTGKHGAADRLIYLRGDTLAFDLEAALAKNRVNIAPVIAYRSVAMDTLPPDVLKGLETADIDVVTLMSPRTARIWSRLVLALASPVQLSGLTYLCLSGRVAEALGPPAKADKVRVASHPNLEEMLALIKRLAASSKAE
ncbi:MAG: uroporphyrinogen-III synthase [Proteobacteria bacterium]|nr:uroporphyrinogen-III synthase [Pseudomonadota bacterium]